MDIYQAIEKWKQNYLSPFCLNNCRGHCCKQKFKFKINQEQIAEIFKANRDPNLKIPTEKVEGEPNLFWIETYQNEQHPHCPAFCVFTKVCKIQRNKPQMCLEFPIIIKKDEITLCRKCLLSRTRKEAVEKLKSICVEYDYSLYIE